MAIETKKKPAGKSAARTVATPATRTKTAAPVAKQPLAPARKTAKPVKAVAKPAAKPSIPAPTPATTVRVAPVLADKITKQKKPKMVRDSFTFPKDEYAVLDALKMRAAKLGNPIKKTELLRAGIKAIAAMQDAALLAALQAVPSLKTGRPAKTKAS